MLQSPIRNSELVVIGASKGGMRALRVVLAALPPDFPLPVAVVLHRDKGPGEGATTNLQPHTPLRMEEPDDKQTIQPGRIYLAPADYHLLIECRMRIADCGLRIAE